MMLRVGVYLLFTICGGALGKQLPEGRGDEVPATPPATPTPTPGEYGSNDYSDYYYDEDVENVDIPKFNATLPGFRTRITQKGFDYASEIGLDLLMKELAKDHGDIPSVSAAMGPTMVTMKNIQLGHVQRPQAMVAPSENYGMRWYISGLTFNMSAQYTSKFKLGFFTMRKSGTVQVDVKDFVIITDFMVGRDESGRPRIYHTQCSADVDDISLRFKGDWSDMLNVGASVLKYQLRSVLEAQVCFRAREQVSTTLQKELTTLPTLIPLDDDFEVDFRLVRTPTFARDYIDTHHKGDIHLQGELVDPPFKPTPIPEYPDHTEKMVYMYFTDYLINSGIEAAYRNNLLRIDIGAHQLPPDALDFFDPNCEAMMCLNTIFPSIADDYPDAVPALTVRADRAPMVTVDGHKLRTRSVGRTDVYMVKDGQQHFIFAILLTATMEFEVEVRGNRLMFNVTEINHDTELTDSTVGNIFTGFLFETALGIAIEDMALPHLKALGVEGIPLPSLEHVDFINGEIIEHEADGVLIAGCDFHVKKLPDIDFVDI